MRIPIAKDSLPFVGSFGLLAVLLYAAGFPLPAGIALLIAGACAAFFRDPERKIPDDPDAIVAPADGRVVAVERDGEASRISIFLSVFDVHVNRAPIRGRVGPVSYAPGRFLAAFDPRASECNERTSIPLEGERGAVVVRQIAGLIARRIVCRVREGDVLAAGQRLGLIRFGSRTDLILPPEAAVTVSPGERVRGGSTIVARWNAPEGEGR